MMNSHHAAIATPYTQKARAPARHSGHREYGGKKPSSPAPSAISPSLRSSGRGAIRVAWTPRYSVTIAESSVVIVSAEVPVQSPVMNQYAGLTSTKKIVQIAKIQASD